MNWTMLQAGWMLCLKRLSSWEDLKHGRACRTRSRCAPTFLIMSPARFKPYDAEAVWERKDVEASSQLLESFAEDYVLHLELNLRRVAGEAALTLAKQPPLTQTNVATGDSNLQNTPTEEAVTQRGNSAVRRKARRLNIEAMQTKWQKKYRSLRSTRPNRSNVWYSQRIAEMDLAEGRKAETIRKHMTK